MEKWGLKLLKVTFLMRKVTFLMRKTYLKVTFLMSQCGTIKENLTLKDRVFTCDNCGYVEHRDINASKNILDRGLKSFGLGTSLLDYKQEALRVS